MQCLCCLCHVVVLQETATAKLILRGHSQHFCSFQSRRCSRKCTIVSIFLLSLSIWTLLQQRWKQQVLNFTSFHFLFFNFYFFTFFWGGGCSIWRMAIAIFVLWVTIFWSPILVGFSCVIMYLNTSFDPGHMTDSPPPLPKLFFSPLLTLLCDIRNRNPALISVLSFSSK